MLTLGPTYHQSLWEDASAHGPLGKIQVQSIRIAERYIHTKYQKKIRNIMKYSFPRKEKKEKELAEYVEALGRGHWDRRKFRESWTGWNERPYLKKQGGALLRGSGMLASGLHTGRHRTRKSFCGVLKVIRTDWFLFPFISPPPSALSSFLFLHPPFHFFFSISFPTRVSPASTLCRAAGTGVRPYRLFLS